MCMLVWICFELDLNLVLDLNLEQTGRWGLVYF